MGFRATGRRCRTQFLATVAALAITAIVGAPPTIAATAPSSKPVAASAAGGLKALSEQVSIPYETFTLDNGLRVLVHTDRKAPVVAVSVWYDVGSKHEPKGKTGFAHLFEHLMFNGSENADGDYFEPLQQMGATSYNGTTWYDRTNYYETVPTGALAKTLYLESDRMGHLLGAVTQEKLDNQRGVVQNEKRQGDNKPYGLVSYIQTAALYPEGSPYGHDTIGSMADLDAASLGDVRAWFGAHYGPNNAIIALAGDIDVATAKPLMSKYFGDIPRGPATHPVEVPVPTLTAAKVATISDRVATTRLYRTWAVPGLNDSDAIPLDIGASVLGGLASSRLDNVLVRDEQLAVRVTAGVQSFAQGGQFEVTVDVKPGVNVDQVTKRLDEIIADLIDRGPTAAEIERVAATQIAAYVKGLEPVGGKASVLAEGMLYSNNPEKYRADLSAYANATPARVRSALQKWLRRPYFGLTVTPGTRTPLDEALAQVRTEQTFAAGSRNDDKISQRANPLPSHAKQSSGDATVSVARAAAPLVSEPEQLTFPKVDRAQLSNGVEVIYARRATAPVTLVSLCLDAGYAADPKAKLGTAALTTALLAQGAGSLDSREIAEREEELGANIGAGSSMDRTGVSLSALSTNLAPSLDLFADIALRPTFAPAEVDRVKAQQLAAIAAEQSNPAAIASRVLMPLLYGPRYPYGIPGTGTGEADAVRTLTRDDLASFHAAWFRPEKAKIFVVSDRPLDEIMHLLESRFGTWHTRGAAGAKSFDVPIPTSPSKIVLVDRKDSPQSQISAGQLLPLDGTTDHLDLTSAAEIVGGGFLSRINMDLRETKGWSYGVRAGIGEAQHRLSYRVSAPVQADKTGESIAALIADFRDFLDQHGVTAAELQRTQNGNIRELPGAFETSKSVLAAMQNNDLFGRDDTYYSTLPSRYRAQTVDQLDDAARAAIAPTRFIWVVVGDAAVVKPQLDTLGLPIEVVAAN